MLRLDLKEVFDSSLVVNVFASCFLNCLSLKLLSKISQVRVYVRVHVCERDTAHVVACMHIFPGILIIN